MRVDALDSSYDMDIWIWNPKPLIKMLFRNFNPESPGHVDERQEIRYFTL